MQPQRILVAVLLIATACNGSNDAAETTPAPEPGSEVTQAAAADVTADADNPVDEAVSSILEVGSYAFGAKVSLTVSSDSVESELTGWVDGDDRELLLQSAGESVLTRVVDGVASVDRDGVVTEIPLLEASEAPSLTILSGIEDLVKTINPGEYRGSLTTEALRASGFDDATPVKVTILLTDDGQLAGYLLESLDGAWTADVKFEDIGESFTS